MQATSNNCIFIVEFCGFKLGSIQKASMEYNSGEGPFPG